MERCDSYDYLYECYTASIPVQASDVDAVGAAQISVSNPAPGGGTAAPAQISIVHPVPTIASLHLAAVAAGGAGFTLTVNGTGFSPASVVPYNGAPRATTDVNSTTLTAAVTASDIAAPATAQITVVSGAPGGGTSASATLTIDNYPVPAITSITPASITATPRTRW